MIVGWLRGKCQSVSQSITLVQTEISQQLLDVLPWNLGQTFTVPRKLILVILVSPWLLIWLHHQVKVFTCPVKYPHFYLIGADISTDDASLCLCWSPDFSTGSTTTVCSDRPWSKFYRWHNCIQSQWKDMTRQCANVCIHASWKFQNTRLPICS